jgi:hypothetical protein
LFWILSLGEHLTDFTKIETQLTLLQLILLDLQVDIAATIILGELKSGDEVMLKLVFRLMSINL